MPPKQYGLPFSELTKALKNQLTRFIDHVTKTINLDRSGSKISPETAEEQKATFLRYVKFVGCAFDYCLIGLLDSWSTSKERRFHESAFNMFLPKTEWLNIMSGWIVCVVRQRETVEKSFNICFIWLILLLFFSRR